MKKSNHATPMNRQEVMYGLFYMAFQFLFLPAMLQAVNTMLPRPLSEAELNFTYYLINFLTMTVLFHDFLGNSLRHAGHHLIELVQAVILGLAAYYACMFLVDKAVAWLMPGFANRNNDAVLAMFRESRYLMFIGTVILAPPFEECLFRGLVFRSLYGKSHWLAYGVSIAAFALIHTVGYLGLYGPVELLAALIQYVPAGLWLAWSYAKSGNIFAPILIHAAVNYITINGLR